VSTLHLVRHGQASFGAADYDALSPAGPAQSRALARHWLASGERPTAVFTGAMQRQRQSEAAWREVFEAAGVALPPAEVLAAFDEYAHRPLLREQARWLREARGEALDRARLDHDRRYFDGFMTGALQRWVAGELAAEGLEPWDAFCARCRAGVAALRARCGRGQTVVVFTSAGAISAVCAGVLGLDAERVIALKLALRNASVSTLRYDDARLSLTSFNCIGHLAAAGDPRLVTYR